MEARPASRPVGAPVGGRPSTGGSPTTGNLGAVTGVEVLLRPSDADRRSIVSLLTEIEGRIGAWPLSDQAWLDFRSPQDGCFVAVVARTGTDRRTRPHDGLTGYAQAALVHTTWSIEIVPGSDADGLTAVLLEAIVRAVADLGGGPVRWWTTAATADADRIASAAGLRLDRVLLQMRVPLPLPASSAPVAGVPTRPFRPGEDDDAWLEVNNAAFHWHPEQGGWDRAALQRRLDEPWFDATGFLVHERDGRLAAFCWTKIHRASTPPVGEIYVIAVHPDFHGLGLGRALTVAGLADIAARGITTGMLFVDAANDAAVGLYRDLGFTVHDEHRSFVGDVPAARLGAAPALDTPISTTGGTR